ncbi:MAG: 50S ribosomal protein L17 [Syntrophales bacterium]|nr:50S ribosomal protein L17 [Syntrophales bacterium]
MRHLKATCKLGRTTSHRIAMFRNMVTSLLMTERIKTTDAKAKELRRIADRMVTLGKRGDLHARRIALSYVRNKRAVKKLFEELAVRYKDRAGGYTRVVKLGYRRGDNAPISIVEFIQEGAEKKIKKKTPVTK